MKTEADESFEVDIDGGDDIFATSSLQWLQMKKTFLKKARDYKYWGKRGSKQRVIAMDTFSKYCMKSLQLAADSPSLRKDALFDIQRILHQQRLLPFSR